MKDRQDVKSTGVTVLLCFNLYKLHEEGRSKSLFSVRSAGSKHGCLDTWTG
jgi:hypothetical protein